MGCVVRCEVQIGCRVWGQDSGCRVQRLGCFSKYAYIYIYIHMLIHATPGMCIYIYIYICVHNGHTQTSRAPLEHCF